MHQSPVERLARWNPTHSAAGNTRHMQCAGPYSLIHRRMRATLVLLEMKSTRIVDIRFPTSRTLAGSGSTNPGPDYSAAGVVLRTDHPLGLQGVCQVDAARLGGVNEDVV